MVVSVGLAVSLASCDSGGANGESDDTDPPPAPAGLEASSGDGEVVLQWNGVDAQDLAGYNVYRSTSSLPDSLTSDNRLTSVSVSSFTDTDVENQTTYYYKVTAIDVSQNESGSTNEQEVTPYGGPPGRP